MILDLLMPTSEKIDIAIAGGGLAGALIAWRLAHLRPEVNTVLFERDQKIGGEHTWSFHRSDVPRLTYDWLGPFIGKSWQEQKVIFPSFHRTLGTEYCSINSGDFSKIIERKLGNRICLSASVTAIAENEVILTDGRRFQAGAVIDCRGDQRSPYIKLGFQKFIGQEIQFAAPHGLTAPIIMDASVSQKDGYRFVYVLPFDADRALIEDTRYADGDALDGGDIRDDIAEYVAAQNWAIAKIIREEEGVLPIALEGDMAAYWEDGPTNVARAGLRAGLFHPLTGYSLPYAAGLADAIATAPDLSGPALYRLTREYSMAKWQEGAFYRLLCRMLFRAAEPTERYKVLERFYKLPQGLIERFYAGQTSLKDKARILIGKPPVPVSKAIGCLREGNFSHADHQQR